MEQLFQNALSEQTYKYIQTQQQLSQNENNLSQIDLRTLCQQVQKELETVQKDSTIDYLQVEKEIFELNDEINQTDEVLQDLDEMLQGFQDNLNIIKEDMTSLQQRSFNMNVSLQNRKNLSEKLTNFIDGAVLEPQLISDICNKEIDENYIEYVQKLYNKIKYIDQNRAQISQSQIIVTLEPELTKLNKKACQRIRDFINDKIQLLKKPKTNICIVQGSVLVKYSSLLAYLKQSFPIVFIEVCNSYAETVSRIYQQNYKIYSTELVKYMQNKFTKNDLLISDNNNSEQYKIDSRFNILNNIDEMPIICQVAKQNNQKYNLEQIFKSLNKFLLDSVQGEYQFTLQFFDLRTDQNTIFFGGVLKQTMTLALETLKYQFSQSYDIFSILLITLLNSKYKEFNLNSNNQSVFDFYFEQISIQIWPRFEFLFDQQLQSLKNANINVIKNYEKTHGTRNYHQKIVNFCTSLQKIYKLNDTNKMLYSRIIILKNCYFDIIRKISKDMSETSRFIYLIQVFDLIQQNFVSEFLESQLESEINGYIDKLVELYLQEYFQHLVDFIKKQDLLQDDSQIQQQQNINFGLIENIGQQLNESWNRRVEEIKKELDKDFKDIQILNVIVKKFISQLLAYYNTFFKYVKANHEQFSSQLVPVHIFMKEIKNILKVYFK